MISAKPELQKYVSNRLKIAVKRGDIPEGKFKLNDFINNLFISAYDQFSSFSSARDFSNWLYIKMDESDATSKVNFSKSKPRLALI